MSEKANELRAEAASLIRQADVFKEDADALMVKQADLLARARALLDEADSLDGRCEDR